MDALLYSILLSLALLCGITPLIKAELLDMDTGLAFQGKFMEAGTAYVNSGIWTSVITLHTNFTNAKVFVSLLQSADSETYPFPVVPRIRNVGSTGQAVFEVTIFYPDGSRCPDYVTPGANETISAEVAWMVVEAGGYTLDNKKVQFVIDTALVGGSPTRVFWSHRFGTYCSNTGGAEDVSEPGAIFTIQSTNTYSNWDHFLVPRVFGWKRSGTTCSFAWKMAWMWVQGHSQLPPNNLAHEEVNYFLFSEPKNDGFAVRCIEEKYTMSFTKDIGVSSVVSAAMSYGNPNYFVEEVGSTKEHDDFYWPRIFASSTSYNGGDPFVIYAIDATVTQSRFYLQEDGCLEHENNHATEYFGHMVLGRDTNSIDGFGNTVACTNKEYAVNYYSSSDSSSTSTSAIIAAFFVSFAIVATFSFAVIWPRYEAYMKGISYDRGTPLKDESVNDGSVDRSTTPFTHTSDAAVASSSSSGPFRGVVDSPGRKKVNSITGGGSRIGGLEEEAPESSVMRSPPRTLSVTSSDGVDMGKFHAII